MGMLSSALAVLYKRFRLINYREMFGRIREREGSLSATEAFAVDVIFLLGNPTITKLADTLGISQPNATYKVNNLVSKGYVIKTVSEEDKRECHLNVSNKFYSYYDTSDRFIEEAVEKLRNDYSPTELKTFEKMLCSLSIAVEKEKISN